MTQTPRHTPVLLDEVVRLLAPKEGGRYLDGTVGLGGHANAILQAASCELVGLDRDQEALGIAGQRLAPFGDRVHLVHAPYAAFQPVLAALGWNALDGALLDIGVSSLQLDCENRGFSYRFDAPLDMRMDQNADIPTAKDLVNTLDPLRLRDILARFGEEPKADAIVRRIVEERAKRPITTTGQLAALVGKSYPQEWLKTARHHPATRTFQALRMAVNDELGQLATFLSQILDSLAVGGHLCILTFHSLEDRLVKQTMQRWAKGCLCPPSLPTCQCGHTPEARLLLKKPLTASRAECTSNPRATSAKLRAIEKLA
ncbi:MAG: 16S rRNA (cytosine(1402)-N(4))-methyltransferase RsmH [Desulfovibrio sp.]|nr:16S rRNA (cytosine(1402)-N(4))-methyltransferase RsmH [Desulfovibrio sp.]